MTKPFDLTEATYQCFLALLTGRDHWVKDLPILAEDARLAAEAIQQVCADIDAGKETK